MDIEGRIEGSWAAAFAAVWAACPRASHLLVVDHRDALRPLHALICASGPPRPCRVVLCGVSALKPWPAWCQVSEAADRDAGLAILGAEIAAWPMGTRLHPIGSAGLVAAASLLAAAAGLHSDAVHPVVLEAAGRRVQCVHCKAVREVESSTVRFTCSGCGTVLQARTLFSRRHQAFLGVADPEALA